jgi:CRP-like cAMP-binding protein
MDLVQLDPTAFVADQELIRVLKERSEPVNCEQDRELFKQGGDPIGVYIFHRGDVTLSMTSPNGTLLMSMAAAPSSLLGLPGIIGNVGYSLSASARKGAEVSFLRRDEFMHMMLTEPSVSVAILKVLAAEVRTARQALTNA